LFLKRYSELKRISTFEERYRYLKLDGIVGESTFGFDRYLNQIFYNSDEWKAIRDDVIIRDNGCDLGIRGNDIYGVILIHHMNPISKEDIISRSSLLLDPRYLICTSPKTHRAIHYGDIDLLDHSPIIRRPNDTCPWRNN